MARQSARKVAQSSLKQPGRQSGLRLHFLIAILMEGLMRGVSQSDRETNTPRKGLRLLCLIDHAH